MRALVVTPGQKGSGRVEDVPEPEGEGLLVEILGVGVCGTDREILSGAYGRAPDGEDHLVLGHESLGRVREAPGDSGFEKGDLVVGIVRHPDPVPCPACAAGQWDMCTNGRYTEHGIKGRHGFCSERVRLDPRMTVKLDPSLESVGVLLEPTTIVAKAWDHIERIGSRASWSPRRVLVTGAGPVGLLAALLGVQRGLEVHVLDQVEDGPKPGLVEDLGAVYHHGDAKEAADGADVIIECTGVAQLVFDMMEAVTNSGIVCLTGVSSGGRTLEADIGALNKRLVLENNVVFGSVNANRRHYELAARALAKADRSWLNRIVTRRVPLSEWQSAVDRRKNDVKTVIEPNA